MPFVFVFAKIINNKCFGLIVQRFPKDLDMYKYHRPEFVVAEYIILYTRTTTPTFFTRTTICEAHIHQTTTRTSNYPHYQGMGP